MVCKLALSVDVAVPCRQGAGEQGDVVRDGAASGGVKGHCVGGLIVDAFNDVNFAASRPVGADHPAAHALAQSFLLRTSGITYNAGQVPQIPPGMWARSRTTKARV